MVPKYQRIADALAEQFEKEVFPGGRLPTEQELCTQFSVSRQTVRQALSVLKQEGLITRRQGSGSYLTGLKRDRLQNQVAVLLPTDSDYIYARLRGELLRLLTQAGFSASFYVTEYSFSAERQILSGLCGKPLAGLITDPVKNALPNPNLDLYEKLWEQGVSSVFLGEGYDRFPPHPLVYMDSFGGTKALVSMFAEKKTTGIACVFQQDLKSGMERYLGYVSACVELGIPWDDRNVFWYSCRELTELQKKQETRFLRDFIRQSLEPCSAVIAQNDEIAYWLIKELWRLGRHVPEDVAVASFDGSYLCDISNPRITSLSPSQNPAEAAVQLLLAQLSGRQPESIRIPYQPVLRESH